MKNGNIDFFLQMKNILTPLKLHVNWFYEVIFEIQPKTVCYRLPTHRRGALIGNFFNDPFLFKNRKS